MERCQAVATEETLERPATGLWQAHVDVSRVRALLPGSVYMACRHVLVQSIHIYLRDALLQLTSIVDLRSLRSNWSLL